MSRLSDNNSSCCLSSVGIAPVFVDRKETNNNKVAIKGKLKTFCSDFIVNEIDLLNNIADIHTRYSEDVDQLYPPPQKRNNYFQNRLIEKFSKLSNIEQKFRYLSQLLNVESDVIVDKLHEFNSTAEKYLSSESETFGANFSFEFNLCIDDGSSYEAPDAENVLSNKSLVVNPLELLYLKKLIHQFVLNKFPLLQSQIEQGHIVEGKTKYAVKVTPYDKFFHLREYFEHPVISVCDLNLFMKNPPSSRNDRGNTCDSIYLALRTQLSKETRRFIHLEIQKVKSFLTFTRVNEGNHSKENDVEGKKCSSNEVVEIGVKWKPKKRKRQATIYKIAVLKHGLAHFEFVSTLKRELKCGISFAGIKDAHALTTQFMTLSNASMSKILRAKQDLERRSVENSEKFIKLGHIFETQNQLNIGCLKGNRFEIIVRSVCCIGVSEELLVTDVIAERVTSLKEKGFLNFYGSQRVGEPNKDAAALKHETIKPYEIGRALLQEKFEEAANMIVSINFAKFPEGIQGLLSNFDVRKNYKGILKALPSKGFTTERTLLHEMNRNGGDCKAAITSGLNHSTRTFWINAYQSWIFNRALSYKASKSNSFNVSEGDLYLNENDAQKLKGKVNVVVKTSDAKISDIVMPLPGRNVKYPENEIGDFYLQALKDDDLLEQFQIQDDNDKLSNKHHLVPAGSYRKMIAIPTDIKWEVLKNENEKERSKENINMKFQFNLSKGSYATMLFRELFRSKNIHA